MWALIKKDLYKMLANIFPVFVIFVFILFFMISQDEKPSFFWGLWMFALVAGGITAVEKQEEKNHGYRFMARLPISDREIVQAKYIVLLSSVIFVGLLNLILRVAFTLPKGFIDISRIIITSLSWVFLLLGGMIYVLIFKKGLTRSLTIIWATIIGGLILFLFSFRFLLKLFNLSIPELISLITNLHFIWWILLSIVALGIYYFQMRLAIRTFTKARLNEVY